MLLAWAIFVLALPAAALDFYWLTGPWSGTIIDREANTPIEGAVVTAVYGESRSGWHGWSFHCQAVETVTADSQGKYRFSIRQRPEWLFAFKEGYWSVSLITDSRPPSPPALSRLEPWNSGRGTGFETPLKRRLDVGRQLFLKCPGNSVLWKGAQPFYSAIARDGAKSAATQDERLYALRLCRDAANEGDDGGRVPGMNPRAALTGLEARRLKELAPECLAPTLLAAKVNEGAARNTWRTPIDVDDPRFLSTAIVEDPAASAKRMSELNVTSTGCRPDPDPEALACCVFPAPAGGTEAGKVMLDAVKEAGIPHVADKSGRGACVRRKDQAIASDAASKANAYIRNRP